MNPSGGLQWHWRAWRSQALWRPTCEQISTSLEQLEPSASELLLIGASAGWMMPSNWLQRFSKVTTWDIDPLAAPRFRWRHAAALKASGSELVCRTGDALDCLDRLLRSEPRACVFFDNVLGQYRFHCRDTQQASRKIGRVVRSLRGRDWGALHEAYSGPVGRQRRGARVPAMQRRLQGSADSAAADQAWLGQLGATGEWLDHLTSSVFRKGTMVSHIAWPFKPDYCHWLQVGWVRP